MKRAIFLVCILLVVKAHGQQLKGEIDAISFPEFKTIPTYHEKSKSLSRSSRYDEGYELGYEQGSEDGLDDGENCDRYSLSPGVVCIVIDGVEINCDQDFLDGHRDGWYVGYDEAYQQAIDEKADACPLNWEFDEFLCECICVQQFYYFDGDNDNYYDYATLAKYQCGPPGEQWKTEAEFDGIDCDDSDPNVHNYDECGRCSSTSGITLWYFDGDGDGYHGSSQESCSQPIAGGSSKWSIASSGEDCDDDDPEANVTKQWYYYGDGDSYWGASEESCLRPDTGLAAKWSTDPMSGFDCNDQDSNVFGEFTWYYDNDGDGYHGQEITSCLTPETGVASKWLTVTNGPDCNDSDINAFRRNACGECTDQPDLGNKAYLDLDGDGYHSVEIIMPDLPYENSVEGGEVSQSDQFGPLYGYYDEYQLSPCANLPLVINAAFLRRHNILPSDLLPSVNRDNFVSPEPYSSTEERNQLHTSNWEIRQELSVRDLRYINDFGPNHRIFNHLQLEEGGLGFFEYYYELPNGELLWSNRIINDSIRDKRDAYGDNFWGENYWWLYENWWFLFSGFKDVNFIISETKGEDCDDFDGSSKAYGDWYFDGDNDGYHHPDIAPVENTCSPPSDQWILLDNSKGPDCDDDDPNETVLITWYFDNDLDEYYSTSQESCENPGAGTGDEAKWRQDPGNGLDCFDDDPESNDENRIWYYDFDEDNYYGNTTNSCRNPAIGTEEESLWKPDPGEGEDCDDNDPNSQTFNACGVCGGSDDPTPQYIDIDGDGYHSVYKFEDCGLNEFSGSLIRSGLPESLVGDGSEDGEFTFPAYLSHLTGITMHYDVATDSYTVPDEIITTTTLGLDCDDLSSAELSNGHWYPDVDGDGYHDNQVSPVMGCTPPDPDTYILLSNSHGPDCDDNAPEYHTQKIWYYDSDGDGYYSDSQVSCEPPGEFWNTMSGIGFDDDDDNPFSPGLVPPSQAEIFSVPSAIDVVGEDPFELLEYDGNLYDPSQITIQYRGVTFTYEDLIFERASPEIRLQPNNLLIPEGHPLMGSVIKISGEPVATLAARSGTTIFDTGDEQDLRPCNDWTNQIRELYPGYNSVCGDLNIREVAEAGNYFNELFDPEHFEVFKDHYDIHGHPPFGIKFLSFVDELNADPSVPPQPVIDEIIGPEDEIGIIITARKTVGGTIEYVVSIRDETFESTDAELQREGWKDENGNWTGDLNQGEYNRQLSDMQKFRKLMPGVLALDYSTDAAVVPPSPTVPSEEGLPDLPPEPYPEYNFSNWGFLTKLVEFYEIGYHVSHEFKVPDGIWDPASEGWARWRAKSPASVAGTIDTSIREIRDLAEMVKLAQSLCYKETWEQILEAIKNFNVGEQVRAMISSFDEEIETLRGDRGVHKQHYEIAKIAILTVSAIYTGWKLVGKLSRRFSRIEPEVPVSKLDQKNLDLQDTFADQINKSPEFSGLSKELQEQLTDDLAKIDDGGVFAEALAGNPRLVDSWNVLESNNKTLSRLDIGTVKFFDRIRAHNAIGNKLIDDFPDELILRFSKNFSEISDWGLDQLNGNRLNLIDYWRNNSRLLHNYHNLEHKQWPISSSLTGAKKRLVEHVESIPDIHDPSRVGELSGQLISEVDPRIVAVGIGDGLDDFTIKYNRKKVGGSLIENSDAAYDIVKTQLDPLLKDHLDYLDFIRKDKVGYGNNISDGKIYRTLYDDDTQFFSQKITSAQRPGIHAEILAVDDIIKRMKDSGTNINSLQDLITNNVKVIVKGLNHGHMVMCPHCFTILKDINIVIE